MKRVWSVAWGVVLTWAQAAGAQGSVPARSEPELAGARELGSAESSGSEQGDASPAQPSAEARKEASDRFQRGIRFYEDGDYDLALIEFERAYLLVPDYRVLYNIGQVAISLGRFARARLALERYLEEGADHLPEERRETVERDLEMLRGRTAHLVVRAEPEGAEVWVNDISYGRTPLDGPLLLDAGEHRVVVRKAKHQPFNERVVLAGAEERPLQIVLEPEQEETPIVIVREPDPPKVFPPTAMEPPARGLSPTAISWTATGVLAGSAVVAGLVGLSAVREHNEIMGQPDPSETAAGDARARADRWFLATDILAASAAVAAGVSIYFTLAGRDEKTPPQAGQKPRIEVRSAGSNLLVTGRF